MKVSVQGFDEKIVNDIPIIPGAEFNGDPPEGRGRPFLLTVNLHQISTIFNEEP